jgi:threonine synthase
VTTVSDEEILEAKAVIDAAGIGCEPASAASVAGVRRLVREGVIGPDQRVAAVLTGHLLKDPEVLLANRPLEIDADFDQLARVLNQVTT